jgi:DNA modification methylase
VSLSAPYYQDDAVTIYHADCREILPHLPKVDLVLTDPPYGIGDTSSKKNNYCSYIDTSENLLSLIPGFIKESKEVASTVAFTPGVNNITKYPMPTWVLCWYTTAGAGLCSWGFSCWQPIFVYGKDPFLKNNMGGRPDIIEHTEVSGDLGHPCTKPIRLWKKVLNRVGFDSTTIIDPFMGSGTTLRAAKDLGRKAIGIEIEEKYCEIAAKRMMQEVVF